ncbi:MAG TPA: hypothetical protein VHG93_24745 [Longimicrobium sp.]|nr:hypothetical protein [Longimicrobium sp.]
MKKLLVLAAAALLAAAPAAAQQAQLPSGDQAAVVEQVATPQETQQAPVTPSIHVSREQIQQRVAAMEGERNGTAQMNQSFWYLVAAIALGVLVALLLVD